MYIQIHFLIHKLIHIRKIYLNIILCIYYSNTFLLYKIYMIYIKKYI